MSEIAKYSAAEHLRDGSPVEIRALRPTDEDDMLTALEQTGAQSLQRRFFTMKRHFSDKERAFFMDVDFSDHVAAGGLATIFGTAMAVAPASADVTPLPINLKGTQVLKGVT